MNQQLELLRKRLSGTERPREKFNWKTFWIGSPTAWLALLISLINALYTLAYYNDEVSVVMDNSSVYYARDGDNIHFAKAFTVVNSGTSPIALVQAYVWVTDAAAEPEPSCEKSLGSSDFLRSPRYDVALEPTVVKAGDIGVVPLKQPSDFSLALFREGTPFVLCFELHFIVPHLGPGNKLIKMPLMVLGQEHPPLRTSDFLAPQPKYLVRRNLLRTIDD